MCRRVSSRWYFLMSLHSPEVACSSPPILTLTDIYEICYKPRIISFFAIESADNIFLVLGFASDFLEPACICCVQYSRSSGLLMRNHQHIETFWGNHSPIMFSDQNNIIILNKETSGKSTLNPNLLEQFTDTPWQQAQGDGPIHGDSHHQFMKTKRNIHVITSDNKWTFSFSSVSGENGICVILRSTLPTKIYSLFRDALLKNMCM